MFPTREPHFTCEYSARSVPVRPRAREICERDSPRVRTTVRTLVIFVEAELVKKALGPRENGNKNSIVGLTTTQPAGNKHKLPSGEWGHLYRLLFCLCRRCGSAEWFSWSHINQTFEVWSNLAQWCPSERPVARNDDDAHHAMWLRI